MNIELIEKVLSNKATTSEIEAFEAWLRESNENIANFQKFKKLWDNLDNVYDQQSFDKEAAKLKIQNAPMFRRQKNSKTKKLIWISVAASLLIILGTAFLLTRHSVFSGENVIKYVSNEQKKEVILPDGSHVWLNNHSQLSVPENFLKKQRNVKLWGEAYFEVKQDSVKPFSIKTYNTLTRVLGTSFNIKSDSTTDNVHIVVNSGIVSFRNISGKKKEVYLSAGDVASYNEETNKISKSVNHDLNYLAWKTGILTFTETPLQKVCQILEAQYHQKIHTPLTTEEYKITGSFNNESLDNILTTIAITLDINIKQENGETILNQ